MVTLKWSLILIIQELQLRRVVPVQGREQLQTHFCQREAERDGRGLGAVRQHRHHHVSQVSSGPYLSQQ